MYITRSVAQKLTIAATSRTNINSEADGTWCLTMPSLTGEGTHTKWYYAESMALWGIATVRSNTGEQRKASVRRPPVGFEGSLRTTSTHEVGLVLKAMHTAEHGRDWDSDAKSDATELVDEEAERMAWLKASREESLPDLPYERIMRKISQEPTVIEIEDTFNGTGAQST